MKLQEAFRDENRLQHVVAVREAAWLVKADSCSPGWLCPGVAVGLG